MKVAGITLKLDIPDGLTYIGGSGKITDGLQARTGADGDVSFTEQTGIILIAGTMPLKLDGKVDLATFQCRVNDNASGQLRVGFDSSRTEIDDSDYEILSSDKYSVTGVVLTASANAGSSAQSGSVMSVSVSPETLSMKIGETKNLNAEVRPAEASSKIVWSSSNTSVASVKADGTVTAQAQGKAVITAYAGSKSASCQVTVSNEIAVENDETVVKLTGPSECAPGQEIQVQAVLSENPGIINLSLTVHYNENCLTLKKVEDAGILGKAYHADQLKAPYQLSWSSDPGTKDITATGTLATLTFEVVKDAPAGSYQMMAACSDALNQAQRDVSARAEWYNFTVKAGGGTSTQQPTSPSTPAQPAAPVSSDQDCPAKGFTDVDTSLWYHDGVDFVLKSGLMNGVSDNQFAPNADTTRAMLVTILYRMAGSPAVTGASAFADVPAGTWYSDAVNWAASSGVVKGVSDNSFAPNQPVTREQLATILYRFAQTGSANMNVSADLSGYADAASISGWASDGLSWACGAKLIQGKDGNLLAPGDNASRAQIATILLRFAENVE